MIEAFSSILSSNENFSLQRDRHLAFILCAKAPTSRRWKSGILSGERDTIQKCTRLPSWLRAGNVSIKVQTIFLTMLIIVSEIQRRLREIRKIRRLPWKLAVFLEWHCLLHSGTSRTVRVMSILFSFGIWWHKEPTTEAEWGEECG